MEDKIPSISLSLLQSMPRYVRPAHMYTHSHHQVKEYLDEINKILKKVKLFLKSVSLSVS